jgi:spore germination protein GerM
MRATVTIEIRGSGGMGEDTIRVEVAQEDFNAASKSSDFLTQAVRRAHEQADVALARAFQSQW